MLLFSLRFGETQVSRITSAGFLSSRMPMKVQCLKCPASVHSMKATWQTSFGLTQRHWSIFSAVNDSPHREDLFSGQIFKWALGSLQRLERMEQLVPDPRHEAILHLRDEDEFPFLVNAYE
jgi:hypothetical protein